MEIVVGTVSYTHLDVYKRQVVTEIDDLSDIGESVHRELFCLAEHPGLQADHGIGKSRTEDGHLHIIGGSQYGSPVCYPAPQDIQQLPSGYGLGALRQDALHQLLEGLEVLILSLIHI